MNTELAKQLVDISVFDTARNVYYVMLLSKELGKAPEELVSSIHQIRQMEILDKRFAKYLFDALVDCTQSEEQLTLIVFLFKHYAETEDALVSLAQALNDLELWHTSSTKLT